MSRISVFRWLDRSLTAASLLALGFLAYLGMRPGGLVRDWVQGLQSRHRREVARRTLWPELISGNAVLGSKQPTLVLVEFSDYQCPFCRAVSPRKD